MSEVEESSKETGITVHTYAMEHIYRIPEFNNWCYTHLDRNTWNQRFGTYKFKYEIDAVAFKLKFGL
jgi:hypothetical protein